MGFYYGSSEPPPDKGEGTFKEALFLTLIVFRALALPMAVLIGGIAYLTLVFYLFSLNPLFGGAAILLPIGAVVARGVWESRRPPKLDQ